ncbi:MAG: DUF4177 domain-containing protein [Chloroflexota bacterium]|jgi:hypothetical protein
MKEYEVINFVDIESVSYQDLKKEKRSEVGEQLSNLAKEGWQVHTILEFGYQGGLTRAGSTQATILLEREVRPIGRTS